MVDKSNLEATDLRCVWNMGGKCSEKVYDVSMFDNMIKIPICEDHLDDHERVMLLFKNGYDIEEIIQKDTEWRKGEVLTLKLSGLLKDNGETKI